MNYYEVCYEKDGRDFMRFLDKSESLEGLIKKYKKEGKEVFMVHQYPRKPEGDEFMHMETKQVLKVRNAR